MPLSRRPSGLSGRRRPARSSGAAAPRPPPVRQCRRCDRDAPRLRPVRSHRRLRAGHPRRRLAGADAAPRVGPTARISPKGADLWLDGGHNPAAAVRLRGPGRSRRKGPAPARAHFGMINTKETRAAISAPPSRASSGMSISVPPPVSTSPDAGVPNDELADPAPRKPGMSAQPRQFRRQPR